MVGIVYSGWKWYGRGGRARVGGGGFHTPILWPIDGSKFSDGIFFQHPCTLLDGDLLLHTRGIQPMAVAEDHDEDGGVLRISQIYGFHNSDGLVMK